MNAPHAARAIPTLALGGLLAVAGGCGSGPGIDEATRAEVVALGDSAAMTLVRTLGGRLNGALANGGAAHAIGFCAGEAQALTDSISAALGPGWEVKRTTMRTRNPRNAPDSLEAEALAFFHETEPPAGSDAGDGADRQPTHLVQRTPSGDFRYYMPLRMGRMCLQCHGGEGEVDAAVRDRLAERYPADQATGYREGELRGLVRVTVPRAALGG